MAKISLQDGEIPKRMDDFVIYPLDGDLIIRQKSGFTSEALLEHPKYALCRQNASEFGLVSKTCKAIRVLLQDELTKHNNLEVVNSFTKKMRSLLVYDELHTRGNRNLKTALTAPAAIHELMGYFFTPDCKLSVTVGNVLTVSVPQELFCEKKAYLGMRFHYLFFDFDSLTGYVESTSWALKPVKKVVSYSLPVSAPEGFWIRLASFSFFSDADNEWLPIFLEERGLVVL